MIIVCADHQSPVGALTLVADESGLTGLYFENHKVGGPPAEARSGENSAIKAARVQLDAYFAGRRRSFELALAPRGTPFQRAVWDKLAEIGFGETRTYGDLAAALGAPNAARAVGAAVGRNPLSIIVPCHRVVGASGALTGFAGGVERKRFLLAHEAAPVLSHRR